MGRGRWAYFNRLGIFKEGWVESRTKSGGKRKKGGGGEKKVVKFSRGSTTLPTSAETRERHRKKRLHYSSELKKEEEVIQILIPENIKSNRIRSHLIQETKKYPTPGKPRIFTAHTNKCHDRNQP